MSNVKRSFIRYMFWTLSVAIMVLIYFFSAQEATVSASTSSGVIEKLLSIFYTDFKNATESEKLLIIDGLQHFVRKLAHFSIYASLGASLFSAVYTYEIKTATKFLISLPISLLYAISDEIHQTYIPGRSGMIEDVILDFCGSMFGALIVFIIILVYISFKNRRKNMRKKDLMKRLSELVITVEDLNRKIKYLTDENEELKSKLEGVLESGVISDVRAETEDFSEESVIEEFLDEENKCDGFIVKEVDEIDFDSVNELPTTEIISKPEPILSDDALEYGAGVIGKITVESAKFCDKISEKGGDVRELLGLIMGKSEVCKNDILSIAMSDASTETKRELIDAQYIEALDYFKSISEQ